MNIKQDISIGFKFPWQKWLPLPGASKVFYDPAEPHNGLNMDSSRYANKKGHTVKFVLEVEASPTADGEKTLYRLKSAACNITGNGEASQATADFTKVIQLLDEDGTNVLGSGSTFYAYGDRSMLMKVTYSNISGTIASYPNAWGIHYVQKANGGNDIMEFSSIRENRTDIPQTQVASMPTNHLKVEYDTNDIITTCLIDGTKLVPGEEYIFTAYLNFTP